MPLNKEIKPNQTQRIYIYIYIYIYVCVCVCVCVCVENLPDAMGDRE